MREYVKEIYPMECDCNRTLPPSGILRQCLNYIVNDIRLDGCDRRVILPKLGAVWMITRMKFSQYQKISANDVLIYRTYPRIAEKGHYVFEADALRGDEKVLSFASVFVLVNVVERHAMRLSEVEPLWTSPARVSEHSPFNRLNIDFPLRRGGTATVRMSDCDSNRHLTSPQYLSLICDEVGYWENEEHRMRFMQVDFVSEILPGTEIRFEVGEMDGRRYVRGYKQEDKLAFSAMCEF